MDTETRNLGIAAVAGIFAIWLFNSLGGKFFWYQDIWWFDRLMHLAGGAWVALFALFQARLRFKKSDPVVIALLVFITVFIVGFCWEVFELKFGKVIDLSFGGVSDTLTDLFCDMAGGALALFIFRHELFHTKRDVV